MSNRTCVDVPRDTASVNSDGERESASGTSVAAPRRTNASGLPSRLHRSPPRKSSPHILDPGALSRYLDQLYRAAWALCGSRPDAEDLVQETFVNVLKRPRLLRDDNEIGYLLRALRNTHASRYRRAARRPRERPLPENDVLPSYDGGLNAREIMEAIAIVPSPFRDAVIAVDVVGLSYREAARSLRTPEATISTRLHRGRQHIARSLRGEMPTRN